MQYGSMHTDHTAYCRRISSMQQPRIILDCDDENDRTCLDDFFVPFWDLLVRSMVFQTFLETACPKGM